MSRKNIKVLYRRVSKDNPHKVIVVAQAEEGYVDKHIQHDFDVLEKNGPDKTAAVLMIGFITFSPKKRFIV